MRILRLTNSDDLNDAIPAHQRSGGLAEEIIRQRLNEHVETISRVVWPDPELPEIVDSWLDRYQPDCVFMRASSYWVTYESVPLRLRRKAYWGTGALSRAGASAGAKPWLAASPPFRLVRRAAVRLIGGDTYFTPEAAATTVGATLRRIVAHESMVPVLRGPFQSHNSAGNAAGFARALARNTRFEALLAAICGELHVPYLPVMHLDDRRTQLRDDVHTNVRSHRLVGELEAEAIIKAVNAARA